MNDKHTRGFSFGTERDTTLNTLPQRSKNMQQFQPETIASNQQDGRRAPLPQRQGEFKSNADVLSESDDEEERLDCVHEIYRHVGTTEPEADEDEYFFETNDTFIQHDTSGRDIGRTLAGNMSENDGDVEDSDDSNERSVRA
jgi:hypothetical protein